MLVAWRYLPLFAALHCHALWFTDDVKLNMTVDPGDFEVDLAANIGCVEPPVMADDADNRWQRFDLMLAADNIPSSDPDLSGRPGLICALAANETILDGVNPYNLNLPGKIGPLIDNSSPVNYYMALQRHITRGPDTKDHYVWSPELKINQEKLDGNTVCNVAYNAREVPCASLDCVRSCQHSNSYPEANECVHTSCRLDKYSQEEKPPPTLTPIDPPPITAYTCTRYWDSPPCSLTGTNCPTPTASSDSSTPNIQPGATLTGPAPAPTSPPTTTSAQFTPPSDTIHPLHYHPTRRMMRSIGIRSSISPSDLATLSMACTASIVLFMQ